MQSEPSPSNTITRRSGHPSARPSPRVDAPPMNPTQETERSSGAMARQAGAVVIVGMQIAVPRAAAMTRSTSSGFMGVSNGSLPGSLDSARGKTDEDSGRASPLPAQAVVVGNVLDVVRPLQARVRHTEEIEERLGVAHHGVPRLARVLVRLPTEQPDHVED